MLVHESISPLEIYESLEEISRRGLKRLGNEDRELLKHFGIFLKKDKKFMIRLRLPMGMLSIEQAQKIGELAKLYGEDYLDFTTRQEIELRYVELESLPKLLRALDWVGISTFQTGLNNFRNITSSSFNALGRQHIIDVQPFIEEIEKEFLKQERWIGRLPAKFNSSFLGTTINDCNVYGNDCAFVVAQRGNRIGFKLYLGGQVGVQAVDMGIFVQEDEVVETFWAVVKCFEFLANEGERLYPLLKRIGRDDFLEAIKIDTGYGYSSGGDILSTSEHILDAQGVVVLDNALSLVHLSIPVGLFSGSCLIELASEAEKVNAKILITLEQSIYLLVESDQVESLKKSLIYSIYDRYHSLYFNHQIACTSAETVAFSVLPNKTDAISMANFLQREVPIDYAKVRMYWSSSSRGYGIHGIADIGFEGCFIESDEGKMVNAVNLYIGGKATKEAKEARQIFKSLSLPMAQQKVKRMMEFYRDERHKDESFEMFESRVLSDLSIDEVKKKLA